MEYKDQNEFFMLLATFFNMNLEPPQSIPKLKVGNIYTKATATIPLFI